MLLVDASGFSLPKKGPWFCGTVYGLFFLVWASLCVPAPSRAQEAKPAVQEWQVRGAMAALRDSLYEVRMSAVYALIEQARTDSLRLHIPVLLKDFESRGFATPSDAKEALGELLGYPSLSAEITRGLDRFLKSNDSSARMAAIGVLGEQTSLAPEVIGQLRELVSRSDRPTQIAALELLIRQTTLTPDVIKQLFGFLRAQDESLQGALIEALGTQTNLLPGVVEQLIGFLNGKATRRAGIGALGNQDGLAAEIARQQLKALLKSPSIDIQQAAIIALGKQTNHVPETIERLREFLESQNKGLQRATIEVLGSQTSLAPDVVKQLTGILESKDKSIQRIVIEALGNQTNLAPEIVNQLSRFLKSEDPNIQSVTIQALGNQTNLAPEIGQELVKFLKSDNPFEYGIAKSALGNQKSLPPEVIKTLTELLKSPNDDVQGAAIEILVQQTNLDPDIHKRLIGFLESENVSARRAALVLVDKQTSLAPEVIEQLVKLLDVEDRITQTTATKILSKQTSLSPGVIKALIALLKNQYEDTQIAAVEILGSQSNLTPDIRRHLIECLKHPEPSVRYKAIDAIKKHHLSISTIPDLLIYPYLDATATEAYRFLAHYTGGGSTQVAVLLRWIGKPGRNRPDPKGLSLQQQQEALTVFALAWPATETLGEVRNDLALQIAEITEAIDPGTGKPLLKVLQQHRLNLKKAGYASYATSVSRKTDQIKAKDTLYQWLKSIGLVLLGHLLFWAVLIGLYPTNTWVQSIFFWNPWVRKIGGWGYVQPLLTRVPFLQRRLLLPFRETLLEDARLLSFQEDSYFAESEVSHKRSGETTPLLETLSAARGIVVLEGESGLGKTMYLRYLAKHNPRISAFVLASQCKEGVIKALAEKLLGMAGDEAFLNSLLYNGAVSLYLDGVNEVGPDTREKISSFLSQYNKAHCVVTTQPINWDLPERVPVYKLLPLKREKIKAFLIKRAKAFDFAMVGFSPETYWQRCEDFLSTSLDAQRILKEELQLNQKVLSNPMDLTIVGQMLFNERVPNLMNLQSEYYSVMAETYRAHHGAAFPLAQFSEYVYSMRLKDKEFLPMNDYYREVTAMWEHKMVVLPVQKVADREVAEWRFRHDKIREFFITQTFRSHPERIKEHFKDPRFRGVYFMLASVLPAGEAARLREDLLRYAVENSDHLLSDEVLRLLWAREGVEKNQKAPEKQEEVPSDSLG